MLRPLSVLSLVVLVHCNGGRPDPLDVVAFPRDASFGFDGFTRDVGFFVDAPDAEDVTTSRTAIEGAVVPPGWTLNRFAMVREPRVMAFASNGDLFVSAPSTPTPGGASSGDGVIWVLTDDDHDGLAEARIFAQNLADVHGLVIANGFLYFTRESDIWRTPLVPGQRVMSGAPEHVATFPMVDQARWTHGLAVSPAGEVYASHGVHSAVTCSSTSTAGSVMRIDSGTLTPMITGLRNPMFVRCHPTDPLCLASELGDDGGEPGHARERFVEVSDGLSYGFPCCNGPNDATHWNTGDVDCSAVTPEVASSELHTTPFGFDWERGQWPTPYRNVFVVAFHGSFYSTPPWLGARVAYCGTDPVTHRPNGYFVDLVRGFAPDAPVLRRPADVAFSPDGRLFIADDQGNGVYALAPPGWVPPR